MHDSSVGGASLANEIQSMTLWYKMGVSINKGNPKLRSLIKWNVRYLPGNFPLWLTNGFSKHRHSIHGHLSSKHAIMLIMGWMSPTIRHVFQEWRFHDNQFIHYTCILYWSTLARCSRLLEWPPCNRLNHGDERHPPSATSSRSDISMITSLCIIYVYWSTPAWCSWSLEWLTCSCANHGDKCHSQCVPGVILPR